MTIMQVAVEIAYDNGQINRLYTEEMYKTDLQTWLRCSGIPHDMIYAYDVWLEELTEDELMLVASGCDEDRKHLMTNSPVGLDNFLDNIFNEVGDVRKNI